MAFSPRELERILLRSRDSVGITPREPAPPGGVRLTLHCPIAGMDHALGFDVRVW